jgi:hypothetical protein
LQTEENSIHPMTRLLYGYKVNGSNLAVAIGCCEPTARKKLLYPDKLTLGDLKKIHRAFKIPCKEIKGAIMC